MKQVFIAIATMLYILFGCTKHTEQITKQETIIKVTPPLNGLDSTYMGQPVLRYPDTAVARIREYCLPKGFYVVYKNPLLYFIKRDTLQKVDIPKYKEDHLRPFCQEIYPVIFGTKSRPNTYAQLTISSLNFRVEFSEDANGFPPDYTLEYNISILDTMFDKLKFF